VINQPTSAQFAARFANPRHADWRRLHNRLWRLLLLGGLLLVGGCAGPWLPLYPVSLTQTDCPLRIPDDLVEGETIFCGDLHLPQDRADPAGIQITLPYALIRAESAHPRPDPLIYIAGGPGGSALAEFADLYPRLRPLRRDRDLIFYDQRGTILAQPVLDCMPDARLRPATELTAALVDAEAKTPAWLHPLDANDAAVALCAQRLHAAGIDPAFYATATHARDLIDLAHALGYATYNLYGASYGTRVALETMRLDPPGLRAVVLDSVDPPVVDTYMGHTGLATFEAIGRTVAACAQAPRCAAAYPTLVTRDAGESVQALVAALNADPLPLPAARISQINGDDLLRLLLTRFEPALAPYLPQLLDELTRRETGVLVALLDGTLPPPPRRVATTPLGQSHAADDFLLDLNGALLPRLPTLTATAHAEWLRLTVRNADRARLGRFLQVYLPAALAQPLLRQLARLDDAALAQVFAGLQGLPAHPLITGANLAVECRDEVPFNDYAAVLDAHRAASIPDRVVAQARDDLRHFWAQCALFAPEAAPISQSLPVTSTLPTLILQGALDNVTPPSWAQIARQTLSNGVYVEFPGQGHIVLDQPLSVTSGCPLQIVRDFLADPQAAPDTQCIATVYGASWVLPPSEPQ
jgi:pimeloyl-ACP methyl ester carboxylesterase